MPIEILVADSRQVYRGMDVGTAKPDARARAAVPHHLLDLVAPGEPFTVADWAGRARRLVPEIAARVTGCRWWWAAAGSTSPPCWTATPSVRRPMPRSARG